MHERRRLEGVPRLFAPEMAARHAAQLVVHERDQTVERLGVALAPGQEQFSYIVARGAVRHRLVRENAAGLRILTLRDHNGRNRLPNKEFL